MRWEEAFLPPEPRLDGAVAHLRGLGHAPQPVFWIGENPTIYCERCGDIWQTVPTRGEPYRDDVALDARGVFRRCSVAREGEAP